MVSIYSKVIFYIYLVTREINAPMLIIFRILGETPKNITIHLIDASFGTFLIKSSLLKMLVVNLEWNVKNVMGGWNKDITLRSIQ